MVLFLFCMCLCPAFEFVPFAYMTFNHMLSAFKWDTSGIGSRLRAQQIVYQFPVLISNECGQYFYVDFFTRTRHAKCVESFILASIFKGHRAVVELDLLIGKESAACPVQSWQIPIDISFRFLIQICMKWENWKISVVDSRCSSVDISDWVNYFQSLLHSWQSCTVCGCPMKNSLTLGVVRSAKFMYQWRDVDHL